MGRAEISAFILEIFQVIKIVGSRQEKGLGGRKLGT